MILSFSSVRLCGCIGLVSVPSVVPLENNILKEFLYPAEEGHREPDRLLQVRKEER